MVATVQKNAEFQDIPWERSARAVFPYSSKVKERIYRSVELPSKRHFASNVQSSGALDGVNFLHGALSHSGHSPMTGAWITIRRTAITYLIACQLLSEWPTVITGSIPVGVDIRFNINDNNNTKLEFCNLCNCMT